MMETQTWDLTSTMLRCPTCRGEVVLEEHHVPGFGSSLRLAPHPDVREGLLVPHPECPASRGELVLVLRTFLARIAQDNPATTDERMAGYYEGCRRTAQRILEP